MTCATAFSGTLWRSCLLMVLMSLVVISVNAWPAANVPSNDADYYNLQRLQSDQDEDISENEVVEKKYDPAMSSTKRALSLFAHWRPHYSGNSETRGSGSDFVSAVARGGGGSRPLGQPLRWG